MEERARQYGVSQGRRTVYYVGGVMALIGVLLFLSTFVSAALSFGNFDNFEGRTQSMALRTVLGFILIIVGGIVSNVGRAGAAGSGLILDPQQARKDLEPFNRAAGGMTDDTLSEIGMVNKIADAMTGDKPEPPAPVVKVRCRHCSSLNDEQARFCNQCGQAM